MAKMRLGRHRFSERGLYTSVGLFAIVFVAWLWVAPKLLKKPAGTPPRNGSNEHIQQMNRTAAGLTPEPVGAPGTSPSPPTGAAGAGTSSTSGSGGKFVTSPTTAVGSSNTLGGPLPFSVGGQSSTAGIPRVGGYAATVFPSPKISYQ